MTEAGTNRPPEHLVRVTHPDGRTEQVRLDVPKDTDPLTVAKQWLVGARRDARWLDGEAELVAPADPEPATPEPAGDGLQPPPA